MRILQVHPARWRRVVGVGGIGTGLFFALDGNHTLDRNESRPGRLLDVREYCKLHIVIHYMARLLGATGPQGPFEIVPVAKVGDDAAGRALIAELRATGIDTSLVQTVRQRPTLLSVCFQYPDGTGGNITTSNSAASELGTRDLEAVETLLAQRGKETIALSVPEAPLPARQRLLDLATRGGAFRVASFASSEIQAAQQAGMFRLLDLLALNQSEAAEWVGVPLSRERPQPFLDACTHLLRDSFPTLQLVLSVGHDGAYAYANGIWNYCPAPQVKVASTAGAGDSLLGGVLAALVAGIPLVKPGPLTHSALSHPLATALELGVMLASYKVTSHHTIHPEASLDTLSGFARGLGVTFDSEIERLFAPGSLAKAAS